MRSKISNQIRRPKSAEEQIENKKRRKEITKQIQPLRKKLRIHGEYTFSVNGHEITATFSEKRNNDLVNRLREILISWSEIYDRAEFARKKMIVNCLINRVEVFRGYKLKIDFNFDFGQFLNGLDAAV